MWNTRLGLQRRPGHVCGLGGPGHSTSLSPPHSPPIPPPHVPPFLANGKRGMVPPGLVYSQKRAEWDGECPQKPENTFDPPPPSGPPQLDVLERLYTAGGGGVPPLDPPPLVPFQCLRLTANVLLRRLRPPPPPSDPPLPTPRGGGWGTDLTERPPPPQSVGCKITNMWTSHGTTTPTQNDG